MTTDGARPPRRRTGGVARMAAVAAVGAAAVIGFQALTGSGTRASGTGAAQPTTGVGSPGVDASGHPRTADLAAGGRGSPASGRKPGPARGSAPASAYAGTGAAAPVTGPRLVVVMDEPGGPFAQQNRLIMQGATLAVAQLDAAAGAGHNAVSLVPEQLDGLTPAAVQARLRAAGPGAVLVLPCDSNSQFSLATGAARYRTLMLAPCDADASLARTIPTYWPVGSAGNDEAAGLAGIVRQLGGSSVFVIDTPGLHFADAMTRYLREAARARQIKVVGSAAVSLGVGGAEVSRAAAAIRAARTRPAAVFTALPPPSVNRLAVGLLRGGVQQTVLGTSAMDTPLTLAKNSAALENAIFGSYGFLRQDSTASSFASAYRARFGAPVGSFPGLGFETIRLLGAAVTAARSTDPAAIDKALGRGLTLPGVALFDRSYSGAADHNPVGTVSVEKISAGSFLALLTSTPTDAPKS